MNWWKNCDPWPFFLLINPCFCPQRSLGLLKPTTAWQRALGEGQYGTETSVPPVFRNLGGFGVAEGFAEQDAGKLGGTVPSPAACPGAVIPLGDTGG